MSTRIIYFSVSRSSADWPVENLAVGYTNMNRNDPKGTGFCWENTYMMSPRGTPAGGGYSTAVTIAEEIIKMYGLYAKGDSLFIPQRVHGIG